MCLRDGKCVTKMIERMHSLTHVSIIKKDRIILRGFILLYYMKIHRISYEMVWCTSNETMKKKQTKKSCVPPYHLLLGSVYCRFSSLFLPRSVECFSHLFNGPICNFVCAPQTHIIYLEYECIFRRMRCCNVTAVVLGIGDVGERRKRS